VCRLEGRRQKLADAFGVEDPAHHLSAFERNKCVAACKLPACLPACLLLQLLKESRPRFLSIRSARALTYGTYLQFFLSHLLLRLCCVLAGLPLTTACCCRLRSATLALSRVLSGSWLSLLWTSRAGGEGGVVLVGCRVLWAERITQSAAARAAVGVCCMLSRASRASGWKYEFEPCTWQQSCRCLADTH
jgi:hypothetical protein